MNALQMVPGPRRPKAGWLHPPDRGSQSASEAYREHLAAWQVRPPSMGRRGHRYAAAAMESFKEHAQGGTKSTAPGFESRAQAARAIFDHIETFDKRERLHGARGYLSPVEFEKQSTLN